MDSENIIYNTEGIPDTHYFLYKNKKYPIKFDFFKYSSKYFQTNQREIENITDIQLIDDNKESFLNLTEEAINSFIQFVQCNSIKLTPKNVLGLNYLSKKYEVSSLTMQTDDYIIKNLKDVVIDILLNQEIYNTIDASSYEEMISNNLEYYVKDDRLLLLKTPTINRIITKYHKKTNQHPTNKDIIEFSFKYLKKHGICSSIIFNEINFGNMLNNYLKRLITEFSDNFNFYYVNSSLIQAFIQTEKENNKLKSKLKDTENERNNLKNKKNGLENEKIQLNNRLSKLQKENVELKTKVEQLKNELKIKQDENDYNRSYKDFNDKIRSIIKNKSDDDIIKIVDSDFIFSNRIRDIFPANSDIEISEFAEKDVKLAYNIHCFFKSGDNSKILDQIKQEHQQIEEYRKVIDENHKKISDFENQILDLNSQISSLKNQMEEKRRIIDKFPYYYVRNSSYIYDE